MTPSDVRIRVYRPDDCWALSRLYRRSVEELGPRHYSAEQVRAWASRTPPPQRIAHFSSDGRLTLIASGTINRPLAFASLEPDGHIQFFYAAPESVGSGIASQLYEALEDAARKREIDRLFAEASEGACGMFVRKGFQIVHRREFEFAGVPMHNYAVEKTL